MTAFVMIVLVCAALLSPQPARAAEVTATGGEAFQQIGQCVAEKNALLVSLVVDESGSLRESDPEDQRVDAVNAIVGSLSRLADDAEGVVVETELATFGAGYHPLIGWGEPSRAELREAVTTQLPGRNQGRLTDYRDALRGAEASIRERESALDSPACKMLLWFTDGALDVDDNGAYDAAEQAALAEICRAAGDIERIRNSDIHVLGLALSSPAAPIPADDQARFQSIVEGVAGTESCGVVGPGAAKGAFLSADDPGHLSRLFAGTGALIQGAAPGLSGEVNTNGQVEIPIDRAFTGFTLIFEGHGDDIALRAPHGHGAYDLVRQTGDIPGVTVSASPDGLYVVDVTGSGAYDSGVWTLAAPPQDVEVLDVYHFWEIDLEAEAVDDLVLGQDNAVVISALRDGLPEDDDRYRGGIDVEVTVNGQNVAADRYEAGAFSVPVDLTAEDDLAQIEVVAQISGVSAEQGSSLGPRQRRWTFSTALPPGYPDIHPRALDFGAFEFAAGASRPLTLTGSSEGETSVCLRDSTDWDQPEGADVGLVWDADEECVTLRPGEEREVTVTVASALEAEGPLFGEIPLELHGVHADEPAQMSIAAEGVMFRPVDAQRLWWIILVALAAAFVLAYVIAHAARDFADRYRLGRDVRVASIAVLIGDGGETRRAAVERGDGAGLVTLDDFAPIGAVQGKRDFSANGLAFKRAGSMLWPWSSYQAIVSAAGAVATTTQAQTGDSKPATNADFAVTNTEYVTAAVMPAEGRPLEATLTVILAPQGVEGIRGELDDVNRRLAAASGPGGVDWAAVSRVLRAKLAGPAGGATRRRPDPGSSAPSGGQASSSGAAQPTASPRIDLFGGQSSPSSDVHPGHPGGGSRPPGPPNLFG